MGQIPRFTEGISSYMLALRSVYLCVLLTHYKQPEHYCTPAV